MSLVAKSYQKKLLGIGVSLWGGVRRTPQGHAIRQSRKNNFVPQGTRFVVRWNCDSTCLRHFVRAALSKPFWFVRDFPACAPITAAHYADASAAYGRLAAPLRAKQIVTRVFVRDFPGYARPKTLSRGRACLRHFVRSALKALLVRAGRPGLRAHNGRTL